MVASWASGLLLALVLYIRQGQSQLKIAKTVPVPTATATPVKIPSNANTIYQPALGGDVDTLIENQQWLAEVTIGIQTFNLIVDTGSSDF